MHCSEIRCACILQIALPSPSAQIASAAETRGLVYIRVVKYGIKTIDSKKDNKDDTNKLIAMTSL